MIELFGSAACPYTSRMREDLHWRRVEFVEYDVDADEAAFARLLELCNGDRTIPVLVRDGAVEHVGWEGRGCYAGA